MSNTIETPAAGAMLLKARLAEHLLQAHRKQVVSEFDAKLRKLTRPIVDARKAAVKPIDDNIAEMQNVDRLLTTPEVVAQPELFDSATLITPRAVAIMRSPWVGITTGED